MLHPRLKAGGVCRVEADGKDGPRRERRAHRQGLTAVTYRAPFLVKLLEDVDH